MTRYRWLLILLAMLLVVGCAKYNTFFNAQRHFDAAEQVRKDAIKQHKDPDTPSSQQRSDYETAIRKAQKVLDEYPGHDLTDDVLFLQAKSYHRLESYRMSIRKLDLLFVNYPATEYLEESLYIQALNYLLLGSADRSQDFLTRLAQAYPESRYMAESIRVSGDNYFAMEEWTDAADRFSAYVTQFPDSEERDRIQLKLARCYWELRDYDAAAEALQTLSVSASSAELAFRARLLRAQVHVRIGNHQVAEELLVELNREAEIYRSQGEVAVVEAENLFLQKRDDEASPLLENMPQEWQTASVKARAADMLGYVYLARGDWEEALAEFKIAVNGRDELDDFEQTELIKNALVDFLASETALVSASEEKVGRLKLLQANALLFGLDRPEQAAVLYREAAADTAVDSTVAARALYGSVVTYKRYLDNEDSVAAYTAELLDQYPESPQAFELAASDGQDLLGYLLTLRRDQQALNYAALSDEERDALEVQMDFGSDGGSVLAGMENRLRRRMVYRSRRPNLSYDPPLLALQRQADKAIEFEAEQAAVAAAAASDTTGQAGPATGLNPESDIDPAGVDPARTKIPASAAYEPGPVRPRQEAPKVEEEPAKEPEEEPEEEEFDLR